MDATQVGPAGRDLGAVTSLHVAVVRGKDAGASAEVPAGESLSIGSAEGNDLVVSDETVSRFHLELAPTRAGIALEDLGSTNGTWLGRVRVMRCDLPAGTQVRIGATTLLIDSAQKPAKSSSSVPKLPGMVYVSEAMMDVARRVEVLARSSSSVLIQGATGAGKELLARALHEMGPRRVGPFEIVEAAALPSTLLEAELFGHERGAFTGADRARRGAFERADGGTLFLDEIGELSPTAQAVLLGVLERKIVRRVGGDKEIPVDVRIVSATHRDLREQVNAGSFRADLYFRLAAGRVVAPPLSARKEDIRPLAEHFARELTGDDGALDAETITLLEAQAWPGNIRELRAAVERVLQFGASELDEPTTRALQSTSGEIVRYRDAKAQATAAFEREYLERLIAVAANNVSEAARLAKMDRPYLIELLKKYGLR